LRTLPLRLSPVDWESLPGYVARYSHTFQFPPGDVIRALGLDRGSGTVLSAGRYGAWLAPDQLERVALATGIDPGIVERMLLSRFAGFAFLQPAGSLELALAAAAEGHEVLIRCSPFCPDCLRANGAWLLGWQLGWSFACASHRVLLVRRCPRCGMVPKGVLRERWPSDHSGVLSDPTRCAHRLGRQLCRAPLAVAETPTVERASLAAQRRIEQLLEGELQPTLAGVELAPPIYLRDLLTLCNLVDHCAQASAQGGSTAQRGRRLLDRPADHAAVLPHALALTDLPDPDALSEALRELAEQRYRVTGQTLTATKSGPMSVHLEAIVRRAISGTVWSSASRQLGLHPSAHRRPDDLDPRLQARHVPQLFWAEDYHRALAELFDFDDFTHWLGRRFCSVLLTRMLTPLDWKAAVRYLDFPERFINDGYNTTFAKLRTHGRFDELAWRVKSVVNQRAENGLVDYKQRRAQLADWSGIDADIWPLLQPTRRPQPWRVERSPAARRTHASVWLWCQLTSGHERAAPVALPTSNLAHHTYFIRDALPTLRERLLILGQLLLATPAAARQTLPTRLAAALHERGHLAAYFYLNAPPLADQLSQADVRAHRVTPRNPPAPYIDAMINERVLAHVAAHSGVDIPSLTTRPEQPRTPPAIRHARRLAAALLRKTALASWTAVAATIGGHPNRLADDENAYRAARQRDPRLARELEQLERALEHWHIPAPAAPATPHRERMEGIAMAIKARAAQLLAASHGANAARRASIVVCRQHTDLTGNAIAAIHGVSAGQTAFSGAIIAKRRRDDPDFERRYRQLLDHAREVQRQAGFANANLTVGTASARERPQDQGSNYLSNGKVA
jgi:hypothetical protein